MIYDTLNTNIRIGQFVRNNRIRMGLSGRELGRKLNISQQHISRLELGESGYSIEFTLCLLNVFGKTFSEFVNEVFYEDTNLALKERLYIASHEFI